MKRYKDPIPEEYDQDDYQWNDRNKAEEILDYVLVCTGNRSKVRRNSKIYQEMSMEIDIMLVTS